MASQRTWWGLFCLQDDSGYPFAKMKLNMLNWDEVDQNYLILWTTWSALTAAPYAANEEWDTTAKDNSDFGWDESPPGDKKQEFGEEASDGSKPCSASGYISRAGPEYL